MKRVKITVLKTTLDRDLAEEYGRGADGLSHAAGRAGLLRRLRQAGGLL